MAGASFVWEGIFEIRTDFGAFFARGRPARPPRAYWITPAGGTPQGRPPGALRTHAVRRKVYRRGISLYMWVAPRRKMQPQSTSCYENRDFPGLTRALKHASDVSASAHIRHDAIVQCDVLSCALSTVRPSAHLENGALNSASKIARLPPQPFQELISVGRTAKKKLDEHLCSASDSVFSH